MEVPLKCLANSAKNIFILHLFSLIYLFQKKQKPNIRNQHREMVAGAGSIHNTFYCELSSGLKLGKHPKPDAYICDLEPRIPTNHSWDSGLCLNDCFRDERIYS